MTGLRAIRSALEKRRVGDTALVLGLAALGFCAGLVIFEPWKSEAPRVERLRVGRLLLRTGAPRPEALIQLSRRRLRSPVLLRGADFTHRTDWASLGAGIDLEALDRLLVRLASPGSEAARYWRNYAPRDRIPVVPLPIFLDDERSVESLLALKSALDRKPVDARFDFAREQVVPEQPGRSLDLYGTLARLDDALSDGIPDVEIAMETLPPAVTARDLADIHADQLVGFFETPLSRMIKDQDRTHNVKLGASILDGRIIMPGARFSFNGALGDRSEARGFRYAPVIAGGVLVEGMGGGTCQLASTLNAAAFFAGLVVVERRPHSRPSSYIKLGLDATVSYPEADLQLENPFPFPVVLHFRVEEAVLRAEIRGLERPYTVTFLRKVIGKRPFPVRRVEDPNLEVGREVITQNGVPGYVVRRYQIIEQGKSAYRFQTVDKYPPTEQIVHTGTAPKGSFRNGAPDAPVPDSHGPYHEVTYLRMVQGPGGLWYEQSHE